MRLDRYLRPATVGECIDYLAEWGAEASLLAGGTDLIPKVRQGKLSVATVIDLAHIPALDRVAISGEGAAIGAMRRLSALQKEDCLPSPMGVLRQCAGHVSSMQVRNAATLGGNICNASPAADTVPGLLVLGAFARIQGKQGAREMPLEAFFTGPGKTVLRPDELLTEIFIPHARPHTGAAYRKYAIRGDSDLAIVGAGALVTLDADGRIAAARVALASVGPTPLLMTREAEMLIGMRAEAGLLREAAEACAESCQPITDQRATREYRKEMMRLWVRDALEGAVAAADTV